MRSGLLHAQARAGLARAFRMPRAWRSACLAPSRMRCREPPFERSIALPGLKESVSALPGFRLAGHPTLTESRESE